MIVVLDWLKDFVAVEESPQKLADMLTMLGMEADHISAGSEISGVVTALITKVDKHPNADKLHLCEVTDGNATFQVVCGAPNVHEGQITVLAKVNAELPDGFRIKPAKLRGIKSFGMLCSERELALSDQHEGIMDLAGNTPIGRDVTEIFPSQLSAIEFDITPNRPDCLSHVGIAREIALKTGRTFVRPEIKIGDSTSDDVRKYVDVVIDDPGGCPRYVAGVMTAIKIGPSPDWMVRRLEAAGQRSINNVVDISNYVLLETGHPTHIFDYKYVPSKKIVVRRAHPGEKIITLDGLERTLEEHHLLITDGGETPVALAGIMGGENSGVNTDTATVLIESAYFDPVTVRKGSKSLGLISESSRRFERGADPEGTLPTFWRIVNLLEKYASGKQVPGLIDNYPARIQQPRVMLRRTAIDVISGCEISTELIEQCLRGLEVEFTYDRATNCWLCTAPSFRPDLEREIDYIEEIIRVFGYDNVPLKSTYSGVYDHDKQDRLQTVTKINSFFVGRGFHQCFTNSLQSKKLSVSVGANPVQLMNPLSKEMSHVRTSLLPGLLQSVEFNINNGNDDLQLYEIGQIFSQTRPGFQGIKETARLTGVLHGTYSSADVHRPQAIGHSHFSLKGTIDALAAAFNLGGPVEYLPGDSDSVFSNCFQVKVGKDTVGRMGKIQVDYIKKLGMKTGAVFGFDFDLNLLITLADKVRETQRYKPIIVFPTVERDLNFVLPFDTPVGNILASMNEVGGNILQKVYPKDLFRNQSIGAENKSVTFHLVFQSPDKTLEDNEVTSVINEIISVVEHSFKAKLRS